MHRVLTIRLEQPGDLTFLQAFAAQCALDDRLHLGRYGPTVNRRGGGHAGECARAPAVFVRQATAVDAAADGSREPRSKPALWLLSVVRADG